MPEPLYKIEELQTEGWKEPFENCNGLTKDQAKQRLDDLINMESISANRLRVTREA